MPSDQDWPDPATARRRRSATAAQAAPSGSASTAIELTQGGSSGLPRTYIGVTNPPFASMAPMYARLPADPSWRYRSIAAGHDAMVSAPQALATLLLESLETR